MSHKDEHGHQCRHQRRHECKCGGKGEGKCGGKCDCQSDDRGGGGGCDCRGEGRECGGGGRHEGCCGQCGSGRFHRRFQNKAERIAVLEGYLAELKAEVQAVEERLADLRG